MYLTSFKGLFFNSELSNFRFFKIGPKSPRKYPQTVPKSPPNHPKAIPKFSIFFDFFRFCFGPLGPTLGSLGGRRPTHIFRAYLGIFETCMTIFRTCKGYLYTCSGFLYTCSVLSRQAWSPARHIFAELPVSVYRYLQGSWGLHGRLSRALGSLLRALGRLLGGSWDALGGPLKGF